MMMPLNAVWIDSQKEFVESMRALLESRAHEPFIIQHLSSWNDPRRETVNWSNVDVVLTEVNQEDGISAFEMIPFIRKIKPEMPFILVSERNDREMFIRAINAGVNGFIEKPVDFLSLKTLMERHRCTGYELRMNEDRKAIFSQGKWVDLTSTEYKIIETLRSAGRRLTRSELQASVWPNSSISENNLDTHLTNLKRKIPELGACINVKRGLGYFLEIKRQ